MSESSDKAGLSSLDLMDSSPSVNRIVRIMLKKPQRSYEELLDAVSQLPEEKRLNPRMLDEALQTLVDMNWLDRIEDGGQVMYRVVLKPKASSSEQLHSTDLPALDVATDRKIDPGLHAAQVAPPKKNQGGVSGFFKSLFGGRK